MGYSPYVEDARFKICEAYSIESPRYYHDQEYTLKALERLRLQNEALTAQANLNKQKTLAYEREQKKKKKREALSAKITNVTGLEGLQSLQGLAGTKKKETKKA